MNFVLPLCRLYSVETARADLLPERDGVYAKMHSNFRCLKTIRSKVLTFIRLLQLPINTNNETDNEDKRVLH